MLLTGPPFCANSTSSGLCHPYSLHPFWRSEGGRGGAQGGGCLLGGVGGRDPAELVAQASHMCAACLLEDKCLGLRHSQNTSLGIHVVALVQLWGLQFRMNRGSYRVVVTKLPWRHSNPA